jgi:hypothetical protein
MKRLLLFYAPVAMLSCVAAQADPSGGLGISVPPNQPVWRHPAPPSWPPAPPRPTPLPINPGGPILITCTVGIGCVTKQE